MINRIVVDTSYLVELFEIPKKSNEAAVKEVKARFAQAIKAGSFLYVSTSALFELANHIAHVNDGYVRKKLAEKLKTAVENSKNKQNPWIIEPCEELADIELLVNALVQFSDQYAAQGLGLTDTSLVLIAKNLKKQYKSDNVYIWTTDQDLKAREPDTEPNPFV